ncbi:MAG: S1 RNA-binding domain-containing protein, partial [Fusobacteriaceae bacterium]
NEFEGMSFEEMLNDYFPTDDNDKQKVKIVGRIAQEDRNFAYIDAIGQPTAIRVRIDELDGFTVGDEVEIILIGESDEGEFLIGSRKKVEMEEGNKFLDKAFENGEIITCKILKKINGGYILEFMKQQGFLPNSLSEISSKLDADVTNTNIDVVIKDIKVDKKGRKIIFSRKDVVMKEIIEELGKVSVGDVVKATIVDILEFGISLKFGNLRGFVHISEISWNKVQNISEMYKIGEVVETKVLGVDTEKKQLKLSIKELSVNPWNTLVETQKIGNLIEGRVTRVVPYGIFVEVVPGVEGLVHVSDFTWNTKKINIGDFVKENDVVKVKLMDMDAKTKKIKLGIKQLSQDPWSNAEEKFKVGTKLTGKVVDVKNFGIFVEDEDGVTTFIHQSDLNWIGEEGVSTKVGDTVEYLVVELDAQERKLKGSLKALRKSPWEKTLENYKVGDQIERAIKTIIDSGMFVTIENGVDGFIPLQLASKENLKSLKDKFKVGDKVKAEIVEMDKEKKKIKLSIKKIEIDSEKNEERELLEKYSTSVSE